MTKHMPASPPIDLQLMYLMCSRFCHDLAAPLGAISIGLDMLDESPEPDSPQQILKYSVQSAMHKLELMRCLCGYGAYTDRPTLAEAREIIDKSVDPDRYTIIWPEIQEIGFYDRIVGNAVRLYIALFMIGLDALPRGGTLRLNDDFSLTLTGPLLKFNEMILKVLRGECDFAEIDSRAIVPYFAHMLSQRLSTKMRIDFDKPNLAVISFE